MNQQFHLVSDAVKQNAINFIRDLPVDQKRPLILDIKEMKRTAEQNRKMWPLLKDLSDQVVWFGNKYDTADWKDLITALVAKTKKQEQRMAPGLDGGVVMFGQRTSQMKVGQMVEVIEA
ncbi:recombination protein NinB, partial [Serratia liquefaciens]|uniref:recombination protein NinB n=1 Tax=Serratia liquefaciens TaxID=614 RepID=UPI003906C6EB